MRDEDLHQQDKLAACDTSLFAYLQQARLTL